MLAAERLDEADGVAQVRRHPHLGDGDRDAGQIGIGQVFLAQDLDQGVTHQLARAQLALAGSGHGGAAGRLWRGSMGIAGHEIGLGPWRRNVRGPKGRLP